MKLLVGVLFLALTRGASAEPLDEGALRQTVLKLPNADLDEDRATQVVAVTVAESSGIDPVILLAQQFIESRFDPTATSRLIGGKRQTGPWRGPEAPKGWTGNLYCGIAQTQATTWARCLALREPHAAITAQVAELRAWTAMTHGNVWKALDGYGCGMAGLTRGCGGYSTRVRALAAKIRRGAATLTKKVQA
jgi:hypothetical protein